MKATKNLDFSGTHFFIIAHPDDWQLFMGEYAFDVIHSAPTKVVIISTDAGDGGKDTAYWQTREKAGIGSVRSVLGFSLTDGDPSEVQDTVVVNGAKIAHRSLRNVSMYFFRLPDGDDTGEGTAFGKYQSMLKLYDGQIDSITSLDGTNTYTKDSLGKAITAIVQKEYPSPKNSVALYILDPGSERKYSHSDHLVTQFYARDSFSGLQSSNCKTRAFRDYAISKKTQNLFDDELSKKVRLFEAYDYIMITGVGTCNFCLKSHLDWLFRSYMREFECS